MLPDFIEVARERFLLAGTEGGDFWANSAGGVSLAILPSAFESVFSGMSVDNVRRSRFGTSK